MTRYGFLIDQDSCIGCHACTVACKSEHDVPLGVNRTWLKYIEKGTFPDVRRLYSVMRCNHCDDAPCVAICPTGALFRRDDGIVDFDTSVCIGCKSCMNACPYDALYMDPEEKTAQKCNFCAHRVDVGLEPSCVVICPTQAIVAGDLDDPASRISQLIARSDVQVRAPEQLTRPKVFYKGADQASLDPTRSAIASDGLIWAESTRHHPSAPPESSQVVARTAYTTAHPTPWGMLVSAYLVTKSISAGSILLAVLLILLGHGDDATVRLLCPAVAGVAVLVTGALLIADLKQPRRFLYILTKPQWGSWLTRGAVILGVHGAVTASWLVAGVTRSEVTLRALAAPASLVAAATAGYTAYLFRQCEGRDLWQTPLLLPTLLLQALAAGSAMLALADLALAIPSMRAIEWTLIGSILGLALVTLAELTAKGTATVELALRNLTRGSSAKEFWIGGVITGLAVPAALATIAIVAGTTWLAAVAGGMSVAGMFWFDDAFVRAGQSVPLS